MKFLDLWQGRTGRLPYLAALIISSAAIVVLPFIAGTITMAYAAGMDPAMAIVRALLRPLLLGIGLLVMGGPLVFFARRRLRELGLSGVWLLLFPIGPLQMLFAFGIASASLGVWPLPTTSPVTGLPFWFEMAFGALLAVLPSGDYLEHSPKKILRFAHFATTCEGRLGRQTFLLHLSISLGLILAIVLGQMIIIGVLGIFSPIRGLARPGAQSISISMLAGAAALASALLTGFVMMFVTASTIRRLHDLNQKGWWIILFPFGLPSVLTLTFLANPLMLASLLINPFTALSIVQGLGCLILLIWLLSKRGSDLDNTYGLSVNPPDLSPSSA
ncbi:Protein of unknown function [Bradyrhizobium lablabi]|uniref:Uncharacterized protein n=1 Tax=Bradyrhizobium lablabi TaxID=722472 RepID=A0A1M6J1U2_9BRAD|nr:DUF805 domain-containing protein [Bradyrhizobium lablabi]SHJ40665.1 Protein of unknown function [Bradyrhizobium lablabi]